MLGACVRGARLEGGSSCCLRQGCGRGQWGLEIPKAFLVELFAVAVVLVLLDLAREASSRALVGGNPPFSSVILRMRSDRMGTEAVDYTLKSDAEPGDSMWKNPKSGPLQENRPGSITPSSMEAFRLVPRRRNDDEVARFRRGNRTCGALSLPCRMAETR